jgi:hypothetical protein
MIDGPLDPFVPQEMPRLMQLWLRPVDPLRPILNDTVSKPIGQFTMRELLAWGATLTYLFSSVMLAEAMLLNLARVAIRGR